jgi:dihydrofolate reductase
LSAQQTAASARELPALEILVAVAANGVIGDRNRLPWHLPADLKRFRALTTGHAMVMGRRTWDSIGRALPERQSIVITHQRDFIAPGADVAFSLEDALARVVRPDPVYCIGGGDTFRIALPFTRRMHVTQIAAAFEGDAFFPEYDKKDWREAAREVHPAGTDAPFAYAFVTYERVPARQRAA